MLKRAFLDTRRIFFLTCGNEKRVEEKVGEEYEYCWAMTQAGGAVILRAQSIRNVTIAKAGECLYHILGCDNLQSSVLKMEEISS